MRCIFCKCDSSQSRSVEHIVPESLGNLEHVLPKGVVCDSCNNYFARKIEGPLLESPWFKLRRSRQWIYNKRRLVPPMRGLVPGAGIVANVWLNGSELTFETENQDETGRLESAIKSGKARSLYISETEVFDEKLVSRFMAKVAIEALAHRVIAIDGWESELIDNPQLDALRRYARIGDSPNHWPIFHRRLYGENDVQIDKGTEYQILHEFTLLYTEEQALFCVLCLFGHEFAIDCGGPETDDFTNWLKLNEGRSPLYQAEGLPEQRLGPFETASCRARD